MFHEENIIVYDNYEISLTKYPRMNTDKEKTDIIIIIFLMHEDFLKKLAKSFDEAVQYYNDCKEYYYVFKFNKDIRNYSAQDIMLIINQTNDFLRVNQKIENQLKYFDNLTIIDTIFYFYIKNRDFYVNLYKSMEHAKKSYFERRDYSYRIVPPNDFYNKINSVTYSAIELMELNAYTQYLVQKKIIKELPIPKYF